MADAVWVVATTSHDEHDQEMLSACRVAVQATLVVGFVLRYMWIPAFSIGSVGYEQWLAGFGAPALVQKVSQIAVLAASLGLTALVVGPMLLLTHGRPACGRRLLLMIPFTAVAITAIRESEIRASGSVRRRRPGRRGAGGPAGAVAASDVAARQAPPERAGAAASMRATARSQ